MKKNFTFILMWLLCVFSLSTKAQTQFWSDTFETAPLSGIRTPQGSGETGTPATSYFKLTDGSNVSQVVAFSGKEGSNYWAGEDHNAIGTGLPSAGAGTDDPFNELQINWTGINITGKSGLSFKGLFAANSTSQAWDNKQACLSGVRTTNTDYIIVEYQIDGGTWTNLIRFYNKGSASGVGQTWKNLYEDTDNNGCGDGTMLADTFGDFTKTISGTGSTMAIRIRVYSEGNNEEWGIDNFRLFETICVPPVVTANPPNRAICVGSNTTFSSIATGATTYQWQVNTGSGFTDITNGGVYSNATINVLTITGATAGMSGYQYRCKAINDIASCFVNSSNATLSISNITALTAQNNIACFGASTGAASVTPSGGIGSYTYSWSPSGGTGSVATGLVAGDYTCTITDAINCQITKTFSINQPAAALTAATGGGKTDVSCYGGANGTATAAPSGGRPGYTYSWAPSGGTSATASGLTAGTYTVTVTDANSCQTTRTFTINQPAAALTAATGGGKTDVSCYGGANGTATVAPSGGTPGYTYSWAPSGGTSATASGLTAGTYTVTVTDANFCQTTRTFTINQPAAALTAATGGGKTDVSCYGGANGTATVAPSGGTSGYTYSWAPSGGTSATASGLTAGTYTVTVTDANSCQTTRTFTINQPAAALTAATGGGKTDVSCYGGANGTATVAPSGGTPGYTYSWAPSGGTSATASGLTAGTYTVTVTDANSCQTTRTFTINQPTAISFTTTTLAGYDYNSPYSQTIVATGGTGTKTYSVTTGSLPSGFNLSPNGEIIGTSTQIADSNFTVTATDANSCITTHDFILKLNQIPITVTATASQTKIYGATDPILIYSVSPNLENGDTFTGALSRAAGENIGNYAINVGTLSAGSKYLMTFVGTNFAITAKPITVTADAAQTKVYGTADPVFTYSVAPSLVSGDSFTGNLTRVAGQNIGNYAIEKGSLSVGNNYDITYISKDFAITAKPITVTADAAQTKVYGTADPVFTYSVAPSLVSGDSFTGNLTRVAGQNIGNYAIEKGSLSAGNNYDITYISKDFAITAKPITVTADAAQTKVYGVANPVYTYTVSPSLVGSDTFAGSLTRAAGENVGTYDIGQGSLSAGSNYTISYAGKIFTITAKPITVTADASQTKVYGTTDPVFAYSILPSLIGSDTFTGTLTRVSGENVGTYAITQGSLSAGSNYAITYTSTDFSITKADQTITWGQTLELGCDGETTVILTATSNSGLPVIYASSNNIAAISNGLLVFNNYGSATITASQGGNNNYNAAPVVVLPAVNSQPNLIRKQFEDIIFFDNSSKSFESYSWYKNGVLVPSQTAQYFKENGALNGTYYAVATKLDGTLITSCPLILSPTVEEEYIKIVPNPVKANSSYELVTNVSSSRLQNAHIEVYSVVGLLVDNKITSENRVTLKAPMTEGIYIVKMTLANGKYFTKNLLIKN
ncbi:MBG domain-containing protein [Flavobacterium yafengii]|uniref:MBG domain-containing protein n=1 Tax=Flavobacterium yafengii TaxID=3041253 RepID=UPI0024A957E0|nr:MBG domain-containing protein [Flavobacterium yafengii]MDI6047053.1 MBG domain-containing protein [Flavobacterium yafengii]